MLTTSAALLERHLAFTREVTPPEGVYALDVDGLLDPAVTFFSARIDAQLVAVGALKQLDDSHAELKSMHTIETARRQGVGRAMVDHLLAVAAERNYQRVSLETGVAFAPARSLYEKVGCSAVPAVRRVCRQSNQLVYDHHDRIRRPHQRRAAAKRCITDRRPCRRPFRSWRTRYGPLVAAGGSETRSALGSPRRTRTRVVDLVIGDRELIRVGHGGPGGRSRPTARLSDALGAPVP